MDNVVLARSAMLACLILPLHAQTVSRQADITGGRGPGRCSVEVSVDHAAEIETRGDSAHLTTLAGQPAYWRRFQCNTPLPARPHDFQLSVFKGRGQVRVVREPRHNHGVAVIHIADPKGGRSDYAFDITWSGRDEWQAPAPLPSSGHGGAIKNAIRMCQETVTDRLNRDRYGHVAFGRTGPDPNPGPNDVITGTASAKRDWETRQFSFSCSVDFRSGRVRLVDIRRR